MTITGSASAPPRRAGRKADVTREDWVEKGLSELGMKGPGALTLEALGRELGVTKGSFYWYFSGRDEFMQLLLEVWEERDTLALIDHVEEKGGGSLEKLQGLVVAANSGRVDFRIEQAIRHWGHQEASIRTMLHRTDGKRLDYMRGLLRRLGSDAATAETQTCLLYALIFGEAMIYRREDRLARRERQEASFWAIMSLTPGLRPQTIQDPTISEAKRAR